VANDTAVNTVSMSRVGDSLREAREKKSLTIDQAQKETHIHSTVIKALEEGKCDNILTPNYVKSFLKKYTDYLGLDSRQIISEYVALHPELKSQAANKARSEIGESADISGLLHFLKPVVFLVVAVSLAVFFGRATINYFKGYQGSKAITAKEAAAAKTKAPVSKKTRAKTTQPAKKTSIAKASQGTSSEGKQAIALSGIQKSSPFSVILKTRESVWVEAKKDGSVLFKTVMPKDAVESFKVTESLELYVAKTEAIELVVNGRSLGSPGKGVKRLEITREGVKVK